MFRNLQANVICSHAQNVENVYTQLGSTMGTYIIRGNRVKRKLGIGGMSTKTARMEIFVYTRILSLLLNFYNIVSRES